MSSVLNEAGVSDREAEVLALLGEHLTNAEVAGRLYISVRTVESHVSSLLRKLGVADRRALAQLAVTLRPDDGPGPDAGDTAPGDTAPDETAAGADGPASTATGSGPTAGSAAAALPPRLPAPLTSFVGRTAERAALADALASHRLVTALGPGGVGKTRLALAVAADLSDRHAGGAWFVGLVSVTDPTMVGAAVASALGFGEQVNRSPTETVITRLGDTPALLVLDNCEHLLDGVAELVERLLSACPNAVVLATSRARLLVPYESVFTVPGLSQGVDDASDAVTLFLDRAAMAGWRPGSDDDRGRVAAICAGLDGIALAIELAAARVATLGLSGLESGLADQLGLLTGGSRVDERHRSVRSALDWSHGLLDDADQVVLRRASLFAAPFTVAAAARVAGHDPVTPADVAAALGRLADHSLLVVTAPTGTGADPGAGPESTRYRMLETIRQYGGEQLDRAGEADDARARHLAWCLDLVTTLRADAGHEAGYDAAVDDLRAALNWSADQPSEAGHRRSARQLALALAPLAFARGTPSEAQRRYQQAAELAADDSEAAEALDLAASAAQCRLIGDEALDLFRRAAAAAERAGDRRLAALELTRAAEFIVRAPGMMAELPPAADVDGLLARAKELAGDDPQVLAAIAVGVSGGDEEDPDSPESGQQAVDMARAIGDVRLISAALDQLTVAQLAAGRILDAADSSAQRIGLLTPRAREVTLAYEYSDALHMAPMTSLGAGDLETCRRLALQRRDLAFFREEGHLRLDWLVVWAAMAGQLDEAVALGARFRASWELSGRPPLGGFAVAPASVAMVHGLRGDDEARRSWTRMRDDMRRVIAHMAGRTTGYGPMFDAVVPLHRGDYDEAVGILSDAPESFTHWFTGVWRQWYAGFWAEAGVLASHEAEERVARARPIVVGNPVATVLVDRAEALLAGDRAGLLAAADALDRLGCPYQHARTLVFAGDDHATHGQSLLATLGATPMPT